MREKKILFACDYGAFVLYHAILLSRRVVYIPLDDITFRNNVINFPILSNRQCLLLRQIELTIA